MTEPQTTEAVEFTESVMEDGTNLSPFVQAITKWLQECFEFLEAGREEMIPRDPFYESHLSDEQIDHVIAELNREYDYELVTFPDYHMRRSGANARAALERLSPAGRRAVVEGLQRLMVAYHQPSNYKPE